MPLSEKAISAGLSFIGSQQLADGSFYSYSGISARSFQTRFKYRTTFVPSLILGCLDARNSQASLVGKKISTFLLKEQSPTGSFNYWAKTSPEYKKFPYPDDMDDTFCALSSLVSYDLALVDAASLARTVKLLLAVETQPGGPYRTWLVKPTAGIQWQDVDLAVNANIQYFLSQVSDPLPSLKQMLEKAIEAGKFSSPYYPNDIPLIYYVARAYRGVKSEKLIDIIQAKLSSAESALQLALLIAAILRQNSKLDAEPYVSKLIKLQSSDGSWPAAAFCIDPKRDKHTYYHGAAVLTTAFAIEALELNNLQKTKLSKRSRQPQVNAQHFLRLADQEITGTQADLRDKFLVNLEQTIKSSNGPEIIQLPAMFNASLKTPFQANRKFFERLSMANLYGWLAYTIYDDFLDEEGKPKLLSVANLAHRKSLQAFQKALPDKEFQEFVWQTFDTIDSANMWELTHCRSRVSQKRLDLDNLPDFGDLSMLAERSLGHLLTPLAVLAKQGIATDSTDSQALQAAMRHYLIAKQLNDDAHDWQADLAAGHMTYVVTTLLKTANLRPGKYELDKIIPDLQKQFWHHTLLDICEVMRQQVREGRKALKKCSPLKPDSVIAKLLDRTETSISDTVNAQKNTVDFLRQYNK